jgi:hypothetical protein
LDLGEAVFQAALVVLKSEVEDIALIADGAKELTTLGNGKREVQCRPALA